MILGGVGLGICSACRAPGAFYYQPTIPGWPGVWMCDSCQLPIVAHLRIRADITAQRARITTPTATRHGNQCPTPTCILDAGHLDHHEDQSGRSWRTYGDNPTCPHGLNGNVYCARCDRCLCEACRAIP